MMWLEPHAIPFRVHRRLPPDPSFHLGCNSKEVLLRVATCLDYSPYYFNDLLTTD